MPGLLLGITLTYWGLALLNILTLNNTLLGILALVTGIVWILVSFGVVLPAIPTRRHE
jgi:hypothetical protein